MQSFDVLDEWRPEGRRSGSRAACSAKTRAESGCARSRLLPGEPQRVPGPKQVRVVEHRVVEHDAPQPRRPPNAATISRAARSSSSSGMNTSLITGTCSGWIACLPGEPHPGHLLRLGPEARRGRRARGTACRSRACRAAPPRAATCCARAGTGRAGRPRSSFTRRAPSDAERSSLPQCTDSTSSSATITSPIANTPATSSVRIGTSRGSAVARRRHGRRRRPRSPPRPCSPSAARGRRAAPGRTASQVEPPVGRGERVDPHVALRARRSPRRASAAAMHARPSALRSAGTASSLSRITTSASPAAAFAIFRGWSAGT